MPCCAWTGWVEAAANGAAAAAAKSNIGSQISNLWRNRMKDQEVGTTLEASRVWRAESNRGRGLVRNHPDVRRDLRRAIFPPLLFLAVRFGVRVFRAPGAPLPAFAAAIWYDRPIKSPSSSLRCASRRSSM